jgi:hypothetical protein
MKNTAFFKETEAPEVLGAPSVLPEGSLIYQPKISGGGGSC